MMYESCKTSLFPLPTSPYFPFSLPVLTPACFTSRILPSSFFSLSLVCHAAPQLSMMRRLLALAAVLAAACFVSPVLGDANKPCPSLPLPVSLSDVSSILGPALKAYDLLLQSAVSNENLAGFVSIVVYDQQIVWSQGYGRRNFSNPEDDAAPDADSLIRIASLTKLLTSQLMFQLADEGIVSLTDPIESCIPEFSMKSWPTQNAATEKPVMLLSLAQHLSGLPREQPCVWGTCNQTQVIDQLKHMYKLNQVKHTHTHTNVSAPPQRRGAHNSLRGIQRS